ncbi:uncharacterized [Tachysurus ichikawai]
MSLQQIFVTVYTRSFIISRASCCFLLFCFKPIGIVFARCEAFKDEQLKGSCLGRKKGRRDVWRKGCSLDGCLAGRKMQPSHCFCDICQKDSRESSSPMLYLSMAYSMPRSNIQKLFSSASYWTLL